LEAAVARAAASRSYEIVAEHLLLLMAEDEAGDTAHLLQHFGVERLHFLARIERALSGLRTGNSGRPVLSESLFQWIEDAWLVASVELGAVRLRSGALLAQFILRPARYTSEVFPELEGISKEELKRDLESILAPSPETVEAAPTRQESAGAATSGKPAATEALSRFAICFTEKARAGQIDPIFGRDREIRQIVDVLARRRKNNPIIVGEPGVGKTALVEGLARAIAAGDVPDSLRNVEVYALDLGLLQAGAGVRGEFENRLKAVIAEVKASPRPIILFIDEAHTLIGAGATAGGSDAANLLKPELARGELRTIAATTWSEYKKYFEKDAALERRFQPVKVDEPSEEDATVMLRGLASTYEKAHGVTIRGDAIVAAVKLAHRYISGRQLPDKAVDLLDTATARVKTELASRPDELISLENSIAAIEREKTAHQRDVSEGHAQDEGRTKGLEERLRAAADRRAALQARWETERNAVQKIKEAQRSLADAPAGADLTPLKSALDRARTSLKECRGEEPLVHSDVDPDVVARVVAGWTGIPVGKMRSETLATMLNLEERLSQRVRGQPVAIKTVAEVIRIAQAGIGHPDSPVGVLLFVGPSGVGKTETAVALADTLYGGERFMTSINMSEFQEKHTVSRLVGSPPGYVGYGEGGVLTEAVRQRPYSVVLLDECEKADLEVMNLFYQVFDKGALNDGEGRTIDFRNTVVILTSNLASELLMELYGLDSAPSTEDVIAAIRPTLSKHFKPALLARMTIVPFAPIGHEVMKQIAEMKLRSLGNRLRSAHGVETTFDPGLVEELARRCTESETGARNVDQTLRSSLMPLLAAELLQHLAGGAVPQSLEVKLSEQGAWVFQFGRNAGPGPANP